MTFGGAIYNMLIGPLELFFEVVFTLAFRLVHNQGLSIICLSLAMNFLVLPLYAQADKMQAKQRDIEVKLQPGVKHIKKMFKGDEQYMMLQTYYRQNHYKPTDSLKGSVSLLLEIPFFIAAYHFLSHLSALNGVSMGPISDLGAPDALLTIAGITINVLPILMTLINFISSAIYLKGFPLKSKIQLYGIAIIFLVFLYKSPAGLVFYWTLNNLFSLCKNIVYKIIEHTKKQEPTLKETSTGEYKKTLFYFATITLTFILGLLIPSSVLASSPAEFINMGTLENPIKYLIASGTIAFGLCVIWFSVFHMLAGNKGKKIMSYILWTLSIIALANYMFFGKDLGTLSNSLVFESTPIYQVKETLINLLVILVILAITLAIYSNKRTNNIATFSSAIIAVAVLILSITNIVNIEKVAKPTLESLKEESNRVAELPLSKEEENVVILMLDRATSAYFPYMLEENPTLKAQFDGFTYYPNTASFGAHTIFALPSLLGGYEYTPEAINARDDELLKDKHNESLKVLPKLFSENGFDVAVCDPSLANYGWIADTSIYDDMDNVNAYITIGNSVFQNMDAYNSIEDTLNRNFFCYAIFKASPLVIQKTLYNDGLYNAANVANVSTEETEVDQTEITDDTATQVLDGLNKATGPNTQFLDNYAVLNKLPNITKEGDKGGLVIMINELTHRPTLLQQPDYTYSTTVDNTGRNLTKTYKNQTITLSTTRQVTNYDCNMAAYIELGKWFDYLRENDMYDNTKIIIASDHGFCLEQYTDRIIGGKAWNNDNSNPNDTMYYNALLLTKDFNKTGEIKINDTLMTIADVPALATQDVIENPINPYTKNPIKEDDKDEIHIYAGHHWAVEENDGTQFKNAKWYTVKKDVRDLKNWRRLVTS